jgi:chaperonin cofactor prefoldin
MDSQTIINTIGGLLALVVGWLGRELWDAVQKLKSDMKDLEINLPTNYVRKDDMEARFDKLEAMLNKLFDKLDNKVDKQ